MQKGMLYCGNSTVLTDVISIYRQWKLYDTSKCYLDSLRYFA